MKLFRKFERVYGIEMLPFSKILDYITWQDLLRQTIAIEMNIDRSIGKIESLIGCEIVLNEILSHSLAHAFLVPVEAVI